MDADGNPFQNSPPDELSAYADQITYLDRKLLAIVDTLIEKSNPDPVIVIQGDHGATIEYQDLGIDPSNRLGILNAYYLPAHQNKLNTSAAAPHESLYPTITPVNTFRVIFDGISMVNMVFSTTEASLVAKALTQILSALYRNRPRVVVKFSRFEVSNSKFIE